MRREAGEGGEIAADDRKAGFARRRRHFADDHAIFASYAPADEPHLALIVLLEGMGHGGAIAAPVAGAFWRAYLTARTSSEDGVIG